MKILEAAEAMPYSTYDELQENVNHIFRLQSEDIKKLSCLLWSLERFGDLQYRDDPAALHIELATAILGVEGAKEELLSLLQGAD